MFGGSTWGQNNQQNQQQQGGGFGFGGQQQQQQQPNTGFGQQNTGFGQPAQQNTGGLFGAAQPQNTGFGAPAQNNSTFTFGANNQAQQQNAGFGGTSRPGFGATGGSTFGQTAPTGGLFGASSNTNTGFGANNNNSTFGKPATNMFGSGQTSTLFGAPKPATTGFGQPIDPMQQSFDPNAVHEHSFITPATYPETGTAQPPYQPTWHRDPAPGATAAAPGNPSGSRLPTHLYHSITAMMPYRGATYEELRLLDYEQNRKTPGAAPVAAGGFGQSTMGGFGQPQQQQQTGGFGQPAASTGFGAKPAGTGLFGSTAPASTGFGTTSGGGLFGAQNTTNTGAGTGLFGSTQQPQQQTTGLFGSTNNNQQTGGLFGGQQQQQQQPAAGGLFSNPNPFGQNNQQAQPAAGTSTFGFGAPKPAFGTTTNTGFGQTNTASTGFGQPQQQQNTGFNFGANNQQQQQQQQQPAAGGGLFGGGFGANTNSTQPASTGLFGATNNQQPPATGGLFGAAAKPATGGLFGSTTNTAPSGGFTFGANNNQQQQQQQPAGGLFGANNTGTTGGLFGAQNNQQPQAQQPAAGGGLFGGGNTTGGGLFGPKPAATGATGGLFGSQTQQQQQPAQTGGLFGQPAGQTGGGLFGGNTLGQNNNQAKPGGLFGGGGGLFGQPAQTQQPTGGASGGLFGSQPAGGSLFGSTTQQQPAQGAGLGGSLFGGSTLGGGGMGQSTQQQPTLTASIDSNPYGSNPLFAFSGQTLDLGSSAKKPALPPLTSSTFRITPRKGQINKLRGFASPASSPARAASPVMGLTTPGKSVYGSPSGGDRYKGLSDSVVPANAFVPRPSIKRLTVTPKSSSTTLSGDDHLESVLGKSALRSNGSTPVANRAALPPASPTTFFAPSPQPAQTTSASNGGLGSSTTASRGASERPPKTGEYWCKPRLEKLKQLSERELKEVPFTAGRRGYGEVSFRDPVDLTGLDLDTFLGTIIQFSDEELYLYPGFEPSEKPARGTGLNRPAQIRLEGCFPKNKTTRQPIKDPNDPGVAKFLKRVKNIPETEFVSWADGNWVFNVEHFSKYGLRDLDWSDEDEEEEQAEGAVEKVHPKAKEAADRNGDDLPPPTKRLHQASADEDHDSGFEDGSSYEDEDESISVSGSNSGTGSTETDGEDGEMSSESASDEDQDLISRVHPLEPIMEEDPPSLGLAKQRLGAEGMKKLKAMQQGGFFTPSSPHVASPRVAPARSRVAGEEGKVVMLSRLGSVVQEKTLKRTTADRADFGSAGENDVALETRAIKRASFGGLESPKVLRQPRKYAAVGFKDSVIAGNEGNMVDAGLSRGKEFRASWGTDGEVVHLGKICAPRKETLPESKAVVFVEKMRLLSESDAVETARADRLVKLHLNRSRVELVDGVPTALIDSSIRFADFARLYDASDRSHEANVFRLGVALFDEIDLHLPPNSSDDVTDRVMEVRRRLALSRWLENAVSPAVDSDLVRSDSRPAKVFTLLSGNQVERAVESAIEGGDVRLASLIAQIGGPQDFRDEVAKQLEDWKKYKCNALISVEYRRIYALLAGVTDIIPGDTGRGIDACPDVLVSKSLDWKRAFGLQLWFGNHFEDDISTVLESFRAALVSTHPPATPLPPYLEQPTPLVRKWTMSTESTDILFGLIGLYADAAIPLDQVLQSRNASPSPFDMRVIWHLYILLSRVLRKRDWQDRDEDGYSASADQVTVGYATQLESIGVWTEAAFVLMHLETISGREAALRSLMFRHPDSTPEQVKHLTETLRVPVEWIHESRAAQLASRGDVYGEFWALVSARQHERAHRILVDKLGVEALLSDDLALVRKLCKAVEGQADSGEFGAKLFLDYANIREEVPRLLSHTLRSGDRLDQRQHDQTDRARLAHLASQVPRLIQLLPALMADKGYVQKRAVLGDMLSHLQGLAGTLHTAGYINCPPVSNLMVDSDRLHFLQAAALESFSKTLDACVSAA